MKNNLAILSLLIINIYFLNGQDQNNFYEYNVILSANKDLKPLYKYAFMPEEFVNILKKDSNFINHYIFNRENYKRTKGEEFYYDTSIKFIKKKLTEILNDSNKNQILRIVAKLETIEDIYKPKVDWGKIFETCESCFFGTYPEDVNTFFTFSLIFMAEKEILEMINYDNGEQWNYALMAIQGGDSFTVQKNSKYGNDILDRRIASYIIDRWKDSNIPEVQKLIEVYRSVM